MCVDVGFLILILFLVGGKMEKIKTCRDGKGRREAELRGV